MGVDVFACSLDQVGLYEMRVVIDKSGGYMVMSDSFSMNVFKDSFRKVFDCDQNGYLNQGFNAKIEIFTSHDCKCSGAIPPLARRALQPQISKSVKEVRASGWSDPSIKQRPSRSISTFRTHKRHQVQKGSKAAFSLRPPTCMLL